MRPQILRAAALAAALGSLAACTSDSVSPPSDEAALAARPAVISAGEWDYHAGDAFLAAVDASLAPDFATAANGDRLELRGTGTLATDPVSVTGGGTFTHRDAAGNVLGSGAWTATELLSFRSYGPSSSPAFPSTFEAGVALMKVLIDPAGAGPVFKGVLQITCHLPGAHVPHGFHEGVRLAIAEVINFNKEASGGTVFVRQ